MNKVWEKIEEETKLKREFVFNNFKEALQFVNKVGELAEEANHHPDIYIHDYKNVEITLSTHETGGISEKDLDLASKIDRIGL